MPFRASALVLVLLGVVLAIARYRPPAVASADAPADRFSSERARAVLGRLLGDGQPHPVASPANDAFRERLTHELRGLGLEPELQRGFSCGGFGACAEVVNVLARLPGRDAGPGVLVAAHYDSVGAGPGAADDGAGVATALELARALRARPARRKVVLLFTDGEEAGLLGARLFVRQPSALAEVGAAVNLEARGTSGPCLMFETSAGNGELVRSFASAAQRPVTGSLFNAVYRALPNDTDFTVLREAGLAGVNLAFIGGVARYHTPRDDLAHLDAGSLQHLGDTALSTARAFADELPLPAASDAVFFDVFSLFVVRFPKPWTLALTAIATLLAAGVLARLFARSELTLTALAQSVAVFVGVLLVAALLGSALQLSWRATGALPSAWIAWPGAARVATALAGLLPVLVLPALLPKIDETPLFVACLVGFTLLAWCLAVLLPEASPLTLLPALAGGALGFFGARAGTLALLVAALTTLLPLGLLLYDALGLTSVAASTLPFALAFAPSLAALARPTHRALQSLLAVAALVVAAGVAAMLRPFSADAPQRVTLAYHESSDTKRARLLIDAPWGPLPQALGSMNRVEQASGPRVLPGAWSAQLLQAPASPLGILAPEVERVSKTPSGGSHDVTLRVRSPRAAYGMGLLVPASAALGAVSIDGQPVGFRWTGTERAYTVIGRTEFEVKLELRGSARIVVFDWTAGLPGPLRSLGAKRPPDAVPSQNGDATVASRMLELQ